MKQSKLILMFLFFTSINFSYSQDSTKIQGGVYTEQLVYENFIFGKIKSIKTNDKAEQYYNKNGKLESEITSGNSLHQYIYDSKGNIIQEISYDGRNFDDEIIGVDSYVFNKSNKLVLESDVAISWGFCDKYSFEYNKKGCLISKKWFSKGDFRECSNFEYNEKNQLISENIFDDSLLLTQKITYKYNINEDIIDINSFDSVGNLMQRYSYDYDVKHNKIKETRYQTFQSYTFEYDEFSHLIKIIQDNPGYERVYKLKLDQHNNWIEKTEYLNGKVNEIQKRTITYY